MIEWLFILIIDISDEKKDHYRTNYIMLKNLFLINNQSTFLNYPVYKINIFVYGKLINVDLMLA